MRKLKAQQRAQLNQDNLVKELRSEFEKIPDHRAANTIHSLPDILMSGYAMFAMKYPSLLSFEQQSKTERSNLSNLFGIEKICSDAQMRQVLDKIHPGELQPLFAKYISKLEGAGVLKEYKFMDKYLLASIDGVHYFRSQKVHCKKCMTQEHQNGEVSYSHSMLGAVLMHPECREVYPLGCEWIENEDGFTKNDHELNASKRLQTKLLDSYSDYPLVIVEDALYANEPHIQQVLENGWGYIINAKPGSHEILYKLFNSRLERGQVKRHVIKQDGYTHQFYWMNNVVLNGQGNVRTNFLYYEEHSPKGKVKKFSWVTSFTLRKSNVKRIMRGGRSRWKIENETFNTLKNQGYRFEHNYGHGHQHLCNVLSSLMLIAFAIDQIIQGCSKVFNAVWQAAKTKSRVWFMRRSLFCSVPMSCFRELMRRLAQEYEIQLE